MMRIFVCIFGFGLWVLGAVSVTSFYPVFMSEFILGLMLVVWCTVFLFVSLDDVQVGNYGEHAGDSTPRALALRRGMNVRTYALVQRNIRQNSAGCMYAFLAGKAFGFVRSSGLICAGKCIRVLMRIFRQARRI